LTGAPRFDDALVMFTDDGIGSGDDELRTKLLLKYLEILDANATPPGAIAFYGRGALLVAEGSPAVEPLRALERRGARLIVCKTCVDWFGIADKVAVGVVGGMGDIAAAQVLAKKVVAP